mgnify:CR=1 FL=1
MPIELAASGPAEQPPHRPFRVTGRLVLAALIGFFLVVAGVNATMMTVAIRTMPGVDAMSAYETSQHFNAEIGQRFAYEDAFRKGRCGARAGARR